MRKISIPTGFDPQIVGHLRHKKQCMSKFQTVSSVRTLGLQINDGILNSQYVVAQSKSSKQRNVSLLRDGCTVPGT